jgi:hypothetical protein
MYVELLRAKSFLGSISNLLCLVALLSQNLSAYFAIVLCVGSNSVAWLQLSATVHNGLYVLCVVDARRVGHSKHDTVALLSFYMYAHDLYCAAAPLTVVLCW